MIVGSAQLNSVTALVKHSRAQSKERNFFSKKDIPNQGLIIIIHSFYYLSHSISLTIGHSFGRW